MRLIIGGAYQGKRTFALGLMDADKKTGGEREPSEACRILDGLTCQPEALAELRDGDLLDHFHLLVRRILSGEVCFEASPSDPEAACERLLLMLKAAGEKRISVVCDELGCGVVPVDREDRTWREMTGRLLCALAEDAREVYRVTAGIGVRIK